MDKPNFTMVSRPYEKNFIEAVNRKIDEGYAPVWDTFKVNDTSDRLYSICLVFGEATKS